MRLQGLGVVASVALLIAGACLLNANDKGAGRQKWEIKTSSGQIPTGWEPFAFDSFDESDPFLLRRRTTGDWDARQRWQIKTSSGQVPVGWEPFAYDWNDESDPFLLRRLTTDKAAGRQKWEIKTSNGKIPVGWEPFAYDSKDKSDPFILRRRVPGKVSGTSGRSGSAPDQGSRATGKGGSKAGKSDGEQKWEVRTSSGRIPAGWEPFAFDSFDESDPFLLRRRTSGNWDGRQKWEIKTSSGQIPTGWEPFAYDSNDKFDPILLRRRIK